MMKVKEKNLTLAGVTAKIKGKYYLNVDVTQEI